MIPIEKVKDIIVKHNNLEKELSSGKIDPKLFAKKSKEYSALGNIITCAREFIKFESEKNDLEPDSVGRLITKGLKEKIEANARDLNFLEKTATLPI